MEWLTLICCLFIIIIFYIDAEGEGKTVAYESIGMDVESARGTAQKCK